MDSSRSDSASVDPVFADQIRALYDNLVTRNVSNLIVAALLVPVLVRVHPPAWILAWFAGNVVVHVARVVSLRSLRARATRDADARALSRAFTFWLIAVSLYWGGTAVLLVAPAHPETQAFLALAIGGLCAGGISANAYYLPALYVRLAMMLVPFSVRVLSLGDPFHVYIGAGALLLLGYLVMYGREAWQTSRRVLALRHENMALVERLEEERANAIRSRMEAEDANRAKSRLFAAASHDLSQPLQALGLWAAVLADHGRSHAGEDVAHNIASSVAALSELFEGILELSRIDAGRVEVRSTTFPVAKLVDHVAMTFGGVALEKGIALRHHPSRLFVHADAILLQRILSNLVSNAVRYTQTGRVVVGAKGSAREVRILIADTGPGIPEEALPHLFDEFFRLPGSGARGFGLGLATVRRLAEIAGYALRVESRVDHGTCITLTVPRAEPLVTVPMETPIESAGAIPLRAIVVEDDPDARAAFEAALGGWGVQCAAVATPADAIVALTQAAAPFALVITDHDLGDSATGLELVARMRGLVPTPLAAILVSGAMTAELESRAREADCIPLRKPISPVRLRATLAYIARSTG